mmetsp:Transcript_2991/g.7000  ORF Transcript_2991/g.7000 Transcript_2991/m.7000 type:complete len:209 (+) Transcript_2991:479-1105(+)
MTTDDVSVRQGRCWPESSEKPVLQLSSTTTVSLVSPSVNFHTEISATAHWMSSAKPVNLAYCVRIQLLHGHNDVFVRHGQSVSTAPFCGPSTMFRYARPCFLSRVISKYPVPIVTVMVRLPFVRNLSQRGLSTSRSKTVIPVISTRSPGAVTRAGSPGISTVGGMLYGPLASESVTETCEYRDPSSPEFPRSSTRTVTVSVPASSALR